MQKWSELCLPHKHKDISSDPQNPQKSWCGYLCTCWAGESKLLADHWPASIVSQWVSGSVKDLYKHITHRHTHTHPPYTHSHEHAHTRWRAIKKTLYINICSPHPHTGNYTKEDSVVFVCQCGGLNPCETWESLERNFRHKRTQSSIVW